MDQKKHKKNVIKCTKTIRSKIGDIEPTIAIILGSGLSGITSHMTDKIVIEYKKLPGFPELKVHGHIGEVIVGKLNNEYIMAFRGRQHFYETSDSYPLKTLIRTIKALGVDKLFISNAAGSLDTEMKPTSLMVIKDHINLMGFNPLVGENDDDFGERFIPMAGAWDKDLSYKLKQAANNLGITLEQGVYIAVRGPNFETPAEIAMMQKLGGNAVGMSSVPDCLIARHCGLKVVGCSCITNMGEGLSTENLNHEHTLKNADIASDNFVKVVKEFLKVMQSQNTNLPPYIDL